ncbi:MAG TPA: Plug domain-containing protein [Gemmatimonadaceae bacterium]|nr:Plug domain-containing protein [Gemmatimonadaceae bacterium]
MLRCARPGLAVGALLYAFGSEASAQVVPPPASEVPIPVKPKTDSGPDSARVKTDTIKAPVGRFADPVLYEIGPQYEWNRTQLFATGALTLVDLLDRIPGITTFRSGWLATPTTSMYNADFSRVRIFYDGIEIDNLDNSTGGVLDLSSIQLWTLEHLSIERSAGQLRIYMRSWRVDNTDPYTRADVATGNEETNLYRGFYGKRLDNGGLLQFAGQQFGVRSSRFAGAGDALSLVSRIGFAKKAWSVDAFVLRHHPTRTIQRPLFGRPPVLGLDATYTDAYLRVGVGASNRGPWLQITAASLGFKGKTAPDENNPATAQPDTLERRISESQYIVSAGYTLGPFRLELEDRLRAISGSTYNGANARFDVVSPIGVISAFAEHDGRQGTTSVDAGIRAQPLPFIAVSGSVSQTAATGSSNQPALTSLRGEVGIKLVRPWVSGGFISADRTPGLAPLVYDTLLLPTGLGRVSAQTGAIRGPLFYGLGIDAWAVHWSGSDRYLPEWQSRSELNYANSFLKRFPRGDFEVRAAGVYEYRSRTAFPLAAGDAQTIATKTVSALLEIRIMRAVLTYQQRNILGWQYDVVPGFEMPRVLAIYGVRWDFWN